ncbi:MULTISPECIES: hypothetical protein [Micrococcaceae]|uniref:hypothetical protein n=1 Tax=Micrococcaceae TaxID=1268 RepID=UPI00160F3A00|nr:MULTISPECIES: hypothetical protein [Micrococcaceae]MBB5750050.1 hypothetical protein [Micrococcus sp. TA1]HRO30745.1 hypothetical protein [Citricoccus sp.]HRO94704.1 hypothetical protein [Citricoccus sp.]
MNSRRHEFPHREDALAWAPPRLTATAELTDVGMPAHVADELERRMAAVAHEEATGEDSRRPLSARELTGYVLTTVAICLLGLLVVIA